ncbi:methyl-accepting chemotaxis protein [Saccharibacillus sp. CPCC 101409]|uniref:methyl-accepting chemotaxis protein n=1 Tax=Saccharibacillus sp. CPCC 101409 TaxID=3058041 RepID=UPI0026721537|nr:methyl-accepting chemotaxis protein [Saccharibacillus sp. CPCC 101409]MDO3409039.1 methyl-accepting chemotaxis protein [Saccharibacillus sp. CPCC 101409]
MIEKKHEDGETAEVGLEPKPKQKQSRIKVKKPSLKLLKKDKGTKKTRGKEKALTQPGLGEELEQQPIVVPIEEKRRLKWPKPSKKSGVRTSSPRSGGPALIGLLKNWRKLNPSRSVGVRLFLIFLIGVVLFVSSLGIFSYVKARDTIKDNAAAANEQTIIQTAQKLDIILQRYLDSSTQVFFAPDIQEAITSLQLGTSDFDRFQAVRQINDSLSNQVNVTGGLQAVYLMPMKEGTNDFFSAGNQLPTTEEIRASAWFAQLEKAEKTVQWLPTDEKRSSYTLTRVMSTTNGSGTKYLVALQLEAKALEEQLRSVSLGDGSRIELIAADGTVVAADESGDAGQPSKFVFKQDNLEESGKFEADQFGSKILAAYSVMKTSGWKLIGTVPVSFLLEGASGILSMTVIFVLIDIVFAVLIGIWMVRMIGIPLGRLRGLMREGATGNLSVRTDFRSKDEIGELATAFNQMMDRITDLVRQTTDTAQQVLDTAGELESASRQTAVSAREIAVATEEIANGASSLAQEAEKSSELTEKIGDRMEKVVSANREMDVSAKEVQAASHKGTQHLDGLLEQTGNTENMVRSLVAKVDSLKESTASVMKVLDVMQNITKQTNILSLNATIEAARAGAAGQGFMVVAGEIRQLASRSRESIDMVGEITDNIQSEMDETVRTLSTVYPMFQDQVRSVKETSGIFVSVQQQMEQFSGKLDGVTTSIGELGRAQTVMSEAMASVSAVAEQSSATSQEVASLSSEQQNVGVRLVELSTKLSGASNELKESISKFTI